VPIPNLVPGRKGDRIVKQMLLLAVVAGLFGCSANEAAAKNPIVVMETSLGTMKIEVYPDKAPITVKNFLGYIEDKHYDGTIFHRIAKDPAVVQGGGFEPGMKEKKTKDPIKNEAGNMLSNKPFTIAMARTRAADSATSQFYINVKDNDFLDRVNSRDGVGYCVFGKVIEGKDVVDKIFAVKTADEKPETDVIIKSVKVEK
jgi:cyclophilin family peptidyl-prolyl cis-trans isomerase